MRRRDYLATTGVTLGAGLAGCLGNGDDDPEDQETAADTGTLTTAVSDGPSAIGDFESLVVTVEEIRVFPKDVGAEDEETDEDEGDDEGADGSDSSDEEDEDRDDEEGDPAELTHDDHEGDEDDDEEGHEDDEGAAEDEDDEADEDDGDESDGAEDTAGSPITIDVDDAKVDLVRVQGERQAFIDETELDVGTYSHMQLTISDDVEAVLADDVDHDNATVETAGNAPLQFNKEFEVRADDHTMFVADFAPHTRGQNNSQGYILRPVPSEIRVLYGDDADNAEDANNAEDSDDEGDGETDE